MDRTFHGRSIKQSIDWKLIICYLILLLIGWVNIYAAIHSSETGGMFSYDTRSGKQLVWIATALVIASIILFVFSPRIWEGASIPIYLGVVVLLVAVIFLGIEVKGSRSWFEFGPVRFQPAEVSKISTSLLLSMVLSNSNMKMKKLKDYLIVGLIIGLPMLIILAESETGSALVYVGFLFVLYRQGLSGWWLGAIGMAILLFILTLTASPYTATAVLVSILLIVNSLYGRNWVKWVLISLGIILLVALMPSVWHRIVGSFIPGVSVLDHNPDVTVLQTIKDGARFFFLSKIKPLYILLAVAVGFTPYLIIKALRGRRTTFKMLSIIGFFAGVIMVFSTDFLFNDVLQPHQRKRIEVLLGLKEDPAGVGYNVNQSLIAIGSGGVVGKGYLNGTQTTFGFVPEQATDFIFCTVGEEWGFLGCAVVIGLYIFMIMRILHDAERSREAFTRIYGYCVASCVFMHLFINIGMTIGIMPVIGIPLPLLSYGGSSLWAFTVLIFIFIALDREEKKYF